MGTPHRQLLLSPVAALLACLALVIAPAAALFYCAPRALGEEEVQCTESGPKRHSPSSSSLSEVLRRQREGRVIAWGSQEERALLFRARETRVVVPTFRLPPLFAARDCLLRPSRC